jgi:Protein of unknown function (DUF3592)
MSTKRLFDLIASKAMGIFYASCGGVLLVQLPSYYGTEVAFEANKVTATGSVVATREEEYHYYNSGVRTVTTYISKVQFQTLQGESIEFTTGSACSSQRDCEFKTVRVQYDPNVPKQARVYSNTTLNSRVGAHIVLALAFFSIGIWLLVFDLGDRPTRSNQ